MDHQTQRCYFPSAFTAFPQLVHMLCLSYRDANADGRDFTQSWKDLRHATTILSRFVLMDFSMYARTLLKSDLRWYFEKRDHRSQCGIICSLLLIIYLYVRGREWLAFECALCTDRCDICSSISNERITTLCPGQCQPNYVIIYNLCLPVIGMRVISNHDSHTG